MADFTIRALTRDDLPGAMVLVRRVFDEFEAPDYSAEGVREFYDYIELPAMRERLTNGAVMLLGGFADDTLAGVLAYNPQGHIHLLFVDRDHQRRGYARQLFEHMCVDCTARPACLHYTVNSSPYAHEVYKRLGFHDTGDERTVNGIRFFPMEREK